MSQSNSRIQYLWQQFEAKKATKAELDELLDGLMTTGPGDNESREYLLARLMETAPGELDQERWQPVLERILNHTRDAENPIRKIGSWQRPAVRWTAAAAAIILALGIGTYIRVQLKTAPPVVVNKPAPSGHDVVPGGNKAVLTLSGGKQIFLDSAANGQIARQGNARIHKQNNGQLAYEQIKDRNNPSEMLYNTLATPRGGQYQLTLPDGTKVWLNAASSITYPIAFTGKERKVTLTGEAYLEVAKDAGHPFKVRIPVPGKEKEEKDALEEIEVLGTAFNVNAYHDEADVRTTLLEGSIRVQANGARSIIRPGEQTAVTYAGKGIELNPHADLDQTVAWKNGLFAFVQADLPTVLRQLARWYNVEVVYEGNIPSRTFNGEIGKKLTLDQVLAVLTKTRVHYTIEGNKLTIRP